MAALLPPIRPALLLLEDPALCPSVARALSATPMRRGGGPLLPTNCRVSGQPGAHHVHTQRVFTEMTRNDKSGKSALLGSQCPSGKVASYPLSVPEAGRGGLLRTQVPPAQAGSCPAKALRKLQPRLAAQGGAVSLVSSGRSRVHSLGAEAGDLFSPLLEAGGHGAW